MRKLILIFIVVFSSCKVTKDVDRKKEDRQLTETTTLTTKRLGDTVRYEIPKIVMKDTIIYKKNYVTGTTQVVRYNEDGKITWVECQSGFIEVIQENNRILIENINSMNKQKDVEIPSSIFIYFFIGLGLFFLIVFFALKKYIKTLIPV
jgi:hypothetical protein